MGLDMTIIRRIYFVPLFLIFLLVGCKNVGPTEKMDQLVFRCHSFWVVAHDEANPKGRIIYEIDRKNGMTITSIAYYPTKNLLAVALTSLEPKKETAIIRILNYGEFSTKQIISTGKDRINGMNFNSNGAILFAAMDINRNYPGELCYIAPGEKTINVLSEGLHFDQPEWDADSDGVYFVYRDGDISRIGYLDANNPDSIKEIAHGSSVSVSSEGKVAYLSDGKIFVAERKEHKFRQLDLPNKYMDPRFTDRIKFVKGSDSLVLQRYKKATVYDLLITSPPYEQVDMLNAKVGMLDFEVVSP